jgi:hypothetical protein
MKKKIIFILIALPFIPFFVCHAQALSIDLSTINEDIYINGMGAPDARGDNYAYGEAYYDVPDMFTGTVTTEAWITADTTIDDLYTTAHLSSFSSESWNGTGDIDSYFTMETDFNARYQIIINSDTTDLDIVTVELQLNGDGARQSSFLITNSNGGQVFSSVGGLDDNPWSQNSIIDLSLDEQYFIDISWLTVEHATTFSPSFNSTLTLNQPAPVPEPATILLLVTGLTGIFGYGRRKLQL